jgi:hypothetical protein
MDPEGPRVVHEGEHFCVCSKEEADRALVLVDVSLDFDLCAPREDSADGLRRHGAAVGVCLGHLEFKDRAGFVFWRDQVDVSVFDEAHTEILREGDNVRPRESSFAWVDGGPMVVGEDEIGQ